MNVLEQIVAKMAEHVRSHHGERPTHVMLPVAEQAAVREWMYANPEAVSPHSTAAPKVAGLTMVPGEEFKVWRDATLPVYVGRFSAVYKCRAITRDELTAMGRPDAVASLGQFIVTAGSLWPGFPIYRAWFVGVISLADIPGVPPAKKETPEMTHEIMFTAADPNVDYDPDPDNPATWHPFAGKVGQQFTATDEVAVRIAEGCAKAVSDGILPAVDVGDPGRAAWKTMILNTLEHMTTGGHGVTVQ